MNRIASDYIGQNLNGFIQKRVDDTSHVSFGEIEVIDGDLIKEEDRNKDFLFYDSSEVPDDLQLPSNEN